MHSVNNVPVRSTPWPSWPIYGESEKQAVLRVIESNQLFAADEVRKFEKKFASYIGVKHVKGLGNATQGLHLALAALGIGVGDEVIVTPYSWISSASCVLMQNAVPIFADIENKTYGLSADAIEEKITDRTKAIILVHMFGYPADIKGVFDIAKKNGLYLIEDASHAFGAEYHDKKIGSFGDISVFSCHQRKAICCGDGGLVLTDNDELDQRIYRLRSFGDKDLSYNYRMTEFAAAIGRVRLENLDSENEIRKENAQLMDEMLDDVSVVKTKKSINGTKGVYYRLLFEYNNEILKLSLDAFIEQLRAEGIPFSKTWEPLHRHPHFNPDNEPARGCPWRWSLYSGAHMKNLNYRDVSLPVAEEYCLNRIFELPVHPPVGAKDIYEAAEAIKKVINKLR